MTGRHYHLFDYAGPADAERVVIVMGSGARNGPRDRGGALPCRRRWA